MFCRQGGCTFQDTLSNYFTHWERMHTWSSIRNGQTAGISYWYHGTWLPDLRNPLTDTAIRAYIHMYVFAELWRETKLVRNECMRKMRSYVHSSLFCCWGMVHTINQSDLMQVVPPVSLPFLLGGSARNFYTHINTGRVCVIYSLVHNKRHCSHSASQPTDKSFPIPSHSNPNLSWISSRIELFLSYSPFPFPKA